MSSCSLRILWRISFSLWPLLVSWLIQILLVRILFKWVLFVINFRIYVGEWIRKLLLFIRLKLFAHYISPTLTRLNTILLDWNYLIICWTFFWFWRMVISWIVFCTRHVLNISLIFLIGISFHLWSCHWVWLFILYLIWLRSIVL